MTLKFRSEIHVKNMMIIRILIYFYRLYNQIKIIFPF